MNQIQRKNKLKGCFENLEIRHGNREKKEGKKGRKKKRSSMPDRRLVSNTRHLERKGSPRRFQPHQRRSSLIVVPAA